MDPQGPLTTPLTDYLQSVLQQIKAALPEEAIVDGIVNFEVSTVVQHDGTGGLRIAVLNFGADTSENQIQKITIPIRILTDTGEAVEKALKAKAEADLAEAKFKKRKFMQI
jgi:hypothetical protein